MPPGGTVFQHLERNLAEQVAAQEDLLAALERQRVSMGQLACERLRGTLDDAGALVQRIAGLVSERRRLLQATAGGESGDHQRAGFGFRVPGVGSPESASFSPAAGTRHPTPVPGPSPDFPAWEVVLARAPAEVSARLVGLRARAHDLAGRIGRVNGANRRVTERALVHFGSLLATMAGAGHATYAPRGGGGVGVKAAAGSTLVDRVA